MSRRTIWKLDECPHRFSARFTGFTFVLRGCLLSTWTSRSRRMSHGGPAWRACLYTQALVLIHNFWVQPPHRGGEISRAYYTREIHSPLTKETCPSCYIEDLAPTKSWCQTPDSNNKAERQDPIHDQSRNLPSRPRLLSSRAGIVETSTLLLRCFLQLSREYVHMRGNQKTNAHHC